MKISIRLLSPKKFRSHLPTGSTTESHLPKVDRQIWPAGKFWIFPETDTRFSTRELLSLSLSNTIYFELFPMDIRSGNVPSSEQTDRPDVSNRSIFYLAGMLPPSQANGQKPRW